jgi:aspartate aminotransferase
MNRYTLTFLVLFLRISACYTAGLAKECQKDTHPNKIDLTIGAYRDETGKPKVLDVVRDAEKVVYDVNPGHEYLGQDGLPDFVSAAQKLMLDEDSPALKEGRVYSIQCISGTGSLRLAMEFIMQNMKDRAVYIPSTTWQNHPTMLKACGVAQGTYRYLDHTGCNLDFKGLMEDIGNCPPKSIVLLHACAHNPSGVDPTDDQWQEILRVMKERDLMPFFDNAYQGFVTGCPITDAYAVRSFAAAGMEMIIACSFAKNFGLYGQRAGCLHFVMDDPSVVPAVGSQLRAISRALYSTCPAYGARLVSTILNDPAMAERWRAQCAEMATRLNTVRRSLYDALVAQKVKGTWEHVITQRGMFSYTGISPDVVEKLRTDYHIYMLKDGRISLAGLNTNNLAYFVNSLSACLGSN